MNRPECRASTKAGEPCRRRAAAGSAYCGVHGGGRRVGAPTKLTADLIPYIASVVEKGVTWEVAAQAAGVHPRTFLEWRDRGADDDEAGLETVFAHLHRELTRARAVGEEYLVEKIRAHATLDWRAAAFLLERRAPERWARRDFVDIEVAARVAPRVVEPGEPTRRDAIVSILEQARRPPAGLLDPGEPSE